jgi:hypothetical protein
LNRTRPKRALWASRCVPDSMVWCLWWWAVCCEAPLLDARAACTLPHLSTANSINRAFQVEKKAKLWG